MLFVEDVAEQRFHEGPACFGEVPVAPNRWWYEGEGMKEEEGGGGSRRISEDNGQTLHSLKGLTLNRTLACTRGPCTSRTSLPNVWVA
jgi:hypothetical protein